MTISQQERALRIMTICTYIPAIPLLIPYGVCTHTLAPALGLIPMTMSTVFGTAKISGRVNNGMFTLILDGLIAVLLLASTIAGFVVVMINGTSWRYGGDMISMIGCFALFPLLLNTAIHCWFVIRETPLLTWIENLFKPRVCQHCQRDLNAIWDMKKDSTPRVDIHVAPPAEQTGEPRVSTALSEPPRYSSTATSAFTTPRPSTDFDAETLDSRGGSRRSSVSTIVKVRDSGDLV